MPMIDLFDDGHCRLLYPIHLVEGVAQIRVGAFTQQERWARVEQDLLAQGWNGGGLCVNARWIPDAETANLILNQDLSAGANWNGVSLIRPGGPVHAASQAPEFKGTPRFIGHANDLFTGLEDQIQRDLEWMSATWSLRSLKVGALRHLWTARPHLGVGRRHDSGCQPRHHTWRHRRGARSPG